MKPFNEPIALRVIAGHGRDGDAQESSDSSPDRGGELSTLVWCKNSRNTESGNPCRETRWSGPSRLACSRNPDWKVEGHYVNVNMKEPPRDGTGKAGTEE